MPAEESLSDDLVASLLAKDAKTSNAKYSMYGLQELMPKRPTYKAPKPNTRFLKNIIRETDSHNAALRAKEASESRAHLRRFHNERGRASILEENYGRLSREEAPPLKRRRIDSEDDSRLSSHRRKGGKDSERYIDAKSRRHRKDRRYRHCSSDRHNDGYESGERARRGDDRKYRHRHKHRHSSCETQEDRYGESRNKHGRQHGSHRRRNRSRSIDRNRGRREHHSRSSSSSNSRSRSPRSRRSHHHRRRRSPNRWRRRRSPSAEDGAQSISNGDHIDGKTANNDPDSKDEGGRLSASDSDPLEAIIGPPPPSPPPKVQSRGRGTFSSASAMDSHFSSTYDPSIDVQPDPEVEDDWDLALEALRDRQKWQKQGAERLKAAGFTEEEVQKWEKGGEKREEDVVWKGRGEGREWDRGKVVGEDGMETKPEWGRLKGT